MVHDPVSHIRNEPRRLAYVRLQPFAVRKPQHLALLRNIEHPEATNERLVLHSESCPSVITSHKIIGYERALIDVRSSDLPFDIMRFHLLLSP
jgi:hypothetical protein